MSQGYGNAFAPAALGYNNPNRQHIVSRASLLSPRNLNPQQAKELYLASVANSRRIRTPMNGGNAHDFWDAYVARQNAHMIALQANPCYVSSPRPYLSPRFDLSPRNLVAAAPHFRRQMPSGSTLPPIGRMSPRIQTAAATPTPFDQLLESEKDSLTETRIFTEASHLKPKTTEELINDRFSDMTAAFRYIDVDNRGTISRDELERALKHWGFVGEHGPDPSIHAVLQACTASDSGSIDYDEFVSAFSKDDYLKHPEKPPPPDPLHNVMAKLRPGVTPKMLRQAHGQIKDKLHTKFGTIAKAFRQWDENKNGFLGREEFDRGLLDLNLNGIPRPVIDSLLDIIDVDDDGAQDTDHGKDHDIQLREFARVFVVEDLLSPNGIVASTNIRALPNGLSPRPPPMARARLPNSPRGGGHGTVTSSMSKFLNAGVGGAGAARMEDLNNGLVISATAAPTQQYRSVGVAPLDKKIVTKKPAALIEEYLKPMGDAIKQTRRQQAIQMLRPGVTEKELRSAQQMIKSKIMDKYKRLDKAFKWMDREREDSGNQLTRDELRDGLAGLNLNVGHVIREEVFQTFYDFMDADGDGEVSFAEFARVISAEDIMVMAPVSRFGV
jgi:Ca2+-binding EF-hand superfamily protein